VQRLRGSTGFVDALPPRQELQPDRGRALNPEAISLSRTVHRRRFCSRAGDPGVFFTRPISLAFMIATALILATMIWPAVRKKPFAG
jgi:hypothetical protein